MVGPSGFQGLFDIAGIANAFIEKQVAARKGPGSGSGQAPSKLEHLFGCSNCKFSEVGCKHCYDTPFASRPAARAKPKEGRHHNSLPAAPTFHPTAEEWQDPFAYLGKIAPEATKAGIALIVPPKGWEPPIQMLDQQTGQLRTDLQVPVRIQPTHLLCRRWPTPAGAPPKAPKQEQHTDDSDSDDSSDAGEDHTPNTPNATKKSNAVSGRCSKAGMAQHKAALVAAAEAAAAEERGEEARKEAILNPAHLDAVATAAQAADGQFGYEHLDQPLSLFDFHRYADWAKRRHFNGPVMTGLHKQAPAGDDVLQGVPPVVSASTAWRAHPPSAEVRRDRGVDGRYVAGSSTAWEEPSLDDVEAEFWRIVEVAEEQVEALYGQDIDSATYCSAFPTIRELAERQTTRLLTGPKNQQQQHFGSVKELAQTIGASDSDDPCHCISMCDCGTCQLCVLRAYAAHPWNINNIPQARGSVLRFVREDVGGKPITGLMVPWVYVGSCFSAFCWHIEDHGLYSINYNHMGAPKVWYGVPAPAAAALDASMRDALPHLFDKDHLLLHKLITMLSPAQLAARGVPVCRAVQVPGSFIVTFPDAYHAGFNSGFNVAEAVNFAAPDWLPFGSSSVVRYRNEERYMTFSHDAMLINVVKEAIEGATKQQALTAAATTTTQPATRKSSLLQQFQQRLDSSVVQLGEAEAAAASRSWLKAGQEENAQSAAIPSVRPVEHVAPPAGSSNSGIPAVSFSTTPLDSSFWWAWYPDGSWRDAAAVVDEAAAETLQGQPPHLLHAVSQHQQIPAEGHHLAASSAQHHQQGQRERVFTMRGAAAGSCTAPQQQQQQAEDETGFIPGAPAAGAAAAAAAAGPPPRVVAAAARSFALAAFTPTPAKPQQEQEQLPPPQQQQQRKAASGSKATTGAKTAPGVKAVPAGGSKTAAAAGGATKAAVPDAATKPEKPSTAVLSEATAKAITTYTLCLAEARRQKLLVRPPSPQLARLALGELALRVELEQQRQTALLLQAGISGTQLMAGTSAATDAATGVHTNTQGVECAVCGCDLSLAAVVSSEEPGRAVCPAHANDLDGPRSSACLLLKYAPGYLDRMVATGIKLIPGAAQAVAAARRRQSWVAAGRFFGGAVLRKDTHACGASASTAVAAGTSAATRSAGATPLADSGTQHRTAAEVGPGVPAAAAAQADGTEGDKEHWKQKVPVLEVKLLGPMYDPAALSKKLFEDLEGSGGDSSSQSRGWENSDVEEYMSDAAVVEEQQQQGVQTQQQQRQQQPGGNSGGDASSGSCWQDGLDAEDAFGFCSFDVQGFEEPEEARDSDDDFKPSHARSRKRRRNATSAAGPSRCRAKGSADAALPQEHQPQEPPSKEAVPAPLESAVPA